MICIDGINVVQIFSMLNPLFYQVTGRLLAVVFPAQNLHRNDFVSD
jgi:hypothetical protein